MFLCRPLRAVLFAYVDPRFRHKTSICCYYYADRWLANEVQPFTRPSSPLTIVIWHSYINTTETFSRGHSDVWWQGFAYCNRYRKGEKSLCISFVRFFGLCLFLFYLNISYDITRMSAEMVTKKQADGSIKKSKSRWREIR